jgi:hypothetical protein
VEIGGEIESPDYPAIWLATLRRRAQAVKERVESLSPLAQPVIDGQHREFLVAALQTAPDGGAAGLRRAAAGGHRRAAGAGGDA